MYIFVSCKFQHKYYPWVSNWSCHIVAAMLFFFPPSSQIQNTPVHISMEIGLKMYHKIFKTLKSSLLASVYCLKLNSEVVLAVYFWRALKHAPIFCLFPWQPCDVYKAPIPQLGNQPYYSPVTNNQHSLPTTQHYILPHLPAMCSICACEQCVCCIL